MNLYFISGLGADRRIFQKLRLPSSYKIHYLEWIPFGKGETMASYARRLATAIDTTQPYCIIGVSLGGMLASEMTFFLQPHRTILLSSAPCATELPPYLRLAGRTRLHYLVPHFIYRSVNPIVYWFFGIRDREEKALFRDVMRAADLVFVRRAVNAILRWKKRTAPTAIIHLHGSADRLLPIRYVSPEVIVKDGGHLMVLSKAEEVNDLLIAALQ